MSPSQMLLLPLITSTLHQTVPCDPHPPTSHTYLVRVESQRCGCSSTLIPLVRVTLTKWGGCQLARGCYCHSSPLHCTRLCPVTPILLPATPTWSEMSYRGVEGATPLTLNLTEWEGSHLARGCCCPSSPLTFTLLCLVTPTLPTATHTWSEMNHRGVEVQHPHTSGGGQPH